jgi:hypothetical protein
MVNGLRIKRLHKISGTVHDLHALMSKKVPHIIFIIFSVISFIALLYHIKGLCYPNNLTPAWRHAIFVGINAICIYGLLKRPNWFIWFVAALTLQQWYSHGSYIIDLWQKQHIIHWISVADILLLPVLFILLRADKKNKQV